MPLHSFCTSTWAAVRPPDRPGRGGPRRGLEPRAGRHAVGTRPRSAGRRGARRPAPPPRSRRRPSTRDGERPGRRLRVRRHPRRRLRDRGAGGGRDAAGPQGDATGFLANLSVVDTDRIEVLRGSGSSLYGSNAVAGVINVTSRTGGGPAQGDVLLEGGGLGTFRTVPAVRGGLAGDRLVYSGAVSVLDMRNGVRGADPYRSVSPQGMVRYRFTPTLSATGRVWYARDRLQITEKCGSALVDALRV